jgi:hypothetical protein
VERHRIQQQRQTSHRIVEHFTLPDAKSAICLPDSAEPNPISQVVGRPHSRDAANFSGLTWDGLCWPHFGAPRLRPREPDCPPAIAAPKITPDAGSRAIRARSRPHRRGELGRPTLPPQPRNDSDIRGRTASRAQCPAGTPRCVEPHYGSDPLWRSRCRSAPRARTPVWATGTAP